MQISVRSHLTAGMVAVVGAGAIAMTPVVMSTNPVLSATPVTAVADVQLAAFSFSDVLGILNTFGLGGALPDITSLIPSNLLTAAVTEFVSELTPVLSGAATETLAYVTSAVAGLIIGPESVLARIVGAAGDIPTVLTTAVQSLSAGDVAAAIQTVVTGLIAPVTAIGQAINDAVVSFQTFVTTKLSTIAAALPNILINSIQAVVSGNTGSVVTAVQAALNNWLSGLVPGASAVAPAAATLAVASAPVALAVAAPSAAAAVAAPRAATRRAAAKPVGAAAAASPARSRIAAAPSEAAAAAPSEAAAAPKAASASRPAAARHAVKAAASAAE